MTTEEVEILRKKIEDGFVRYYIHSFDRPKKFFVVQNPDGSKKYISPVAQTRGARDLFVKSTEQEFKDFVIKTGGVVADDEMHPGDCVCDISVDSCGKEVRTYLKYDPAHFGAKEIYIAPNQIYSSIEEYRNAYFR